MRWVIRNDINLILESNICSEWLKISQIMLCNVKGLKRVFRIGLFLIKVCLFFIFCIVPACYCISALAQRGTCWNCTEARGKCDLWVDIHSLATFLGLGWFIRRNPLQPWVRVRDTQGPKRACHRPFFLFLVFWDFFLKFATNLAFPSWNRFGCVEGLAQVRCHPTLARWQSTAS